MADAFLSVLTVSATVGLLALILALLAPVWDRRVAARWKYWVWLVLAVRLLLPFDLSLPGAPVRLELPAAVAQAPAAPAPPAQSAPGTAANAPERAPQPGLSPAPQAAAPRPSFSPLQLAAWVWLAGAGCFALYHLGGSLWFRRRLLRWARAPKQAATRETFEREKAALGLARPVALAVSDAAPGPLLLGLLRPVLVLPGEEYAPQDLALILRHELTHCRRGDLWYKLILLAAAVLHWFNPLAWLLLREGSADLELRCDDAVLAGADAGQRRAYGEVILASIHRRPLPRAALTTCFRGTKRWLARRFENILTPRAEHGGALLATALAAVAALGVLVSCGAPPAPSGGPSGPEAENSGAAPGYQLVTVDFDENKNARANLARGSDDLPLGIVCSVSEGPEIWQKEEPTLKLTMQLPEGWQLRPAADGEACWGSMLGAPFNLYDAGGALVGTLGFDTYFEGQVEGDDEFYGHGYKARYYWIMSGYLTWGGGYTPVAQGEGTENALCRVSYTPEVSPTGEAFENDGILAYSDQLLRYAALELVSGAATPEQQRAMAASIRLLPGTDHTRPAPTPAPALVPEGFARQSITMPAYGGWETPYNGDIYNVAPFVVTLALPEGMRFQIPADAGQVEEVPEDSTLWGKVPIMAGEKQVGALLYDVYEPLPPDQATDNPRAVYAMIMVPNHMGWDFDYTEVSRTATASSATCLAGFHSPVLPAPADPSTYLWEAGGEEGWDMWYKKGVLSHDDTLGVYIAMYFDYGAVTDEQLTAIAQSVLLAPAAN